MCKPYAPFSMRSLPRWGGVVGLALTLACSDSGPDTDDELGVDHPIPTHDYQLVVVGGGRADSSGFEIVATDGADGPVAQGAALVEFDPAGAFTVQIAVYPDAVRAAARVRELDDLGYPAYAISRSEGAGVRVRIGYFKTRGDAIRFGNIFSDDTGSEFWIDRRANEMH